MTDKMTERQAYIKTDRITFGEVQGELSTSQSSFVAGEEHAQTSVWAAMIGVKTPTLIIIPIRRLSLPLDINLDLNPTVTGPGRWTHRPVQPDAPLYHNDCPHGHQFPRPAETLHRHAVSTAVR